MDNVFESWLAHQHTELKSLAADSDRIAVHVKADLPRDFIVRFDCRTLVMTDGEVTPWDRGITVQFHFPRDYVRVVKYPTLITLVLEPTNLFHPNVSPTSICVGHIVPGTGVVELAYRVHDVLRFAKVSPSEHDSLNPAACAWVRAHMHRFPLDDRPLRRRSVALDVRPVTQGSCA